MSITTFQMDAGGVDLYTPHDYSRTYKEKKSLPVCRFVAFERSNPTLCAMQIVFIYDRIINVVFARSADVFAVVLQHPAQFTKLSKERNAN